MKHKFFDSLNLISKLTTIVQLEKKNEMKLQLALTVRRHKFGHIILNCIQT